MGKTAVWDLDNLDCCIPHVLQCVLLVCGALSYTGDLLPGTNDHGGHLLWLQHVQMCSDYNQRISSLEDKVNKLEKSKYRGTPLISLPFEQHYLKFIYIHVYHLTWHLENRAHYKWKSS